MAGFAPNDDLRRGPSPEFGPCHLTALRSPADWATDEAAIRTVPLPAHRVGPPTAERLYFVHTASDAPAYAVVADNDRYAVVKSVKAVGTTLNGRKGLLVRVRFTHPDAAGLPVTIHLLQPRPAGDCSVTLLPSSG